MAICAVGFTSTVHTSDKVSLRLQLLHLVTCHYRFMFIALRRNVPRNQARDLREVLFVH